MRLAADPRDRQRATGPVSDDCAKGRHFLCNGCGCASGCHREPWPFACAPAEEGDRERLFGALIARCPPDCGAGYDRGP